MATLGWMEALYSGYDCTIGNSLFGVDWVLYGREGLGLKAGDYTVTVSIQGKTSCSKEERFTVEQGEACKDKDVCENKPTIKVSVKSIGVGKEVSAKTGDSKHFITYKGSVGTIDMLAESNLSDEDFEKCFEWDLSLADASSVGKEVYVTVGEPDFHLVRLLNKKTGKAMDKYYVWVIWAEKKSAFIHDSNPGNMDAQMYLNGRQDIVVFEFTIQPTEIYSNAQTPNLKNCFDISRDLKVEYFNPSPTTFLGQYLNGSIKQNTVYNNMSTPTSYRLIIPFSAGNDDLDNSDEDNEFYFSSFLQNNFYVPDWVYQTSPNTLTSFDAPTSPAIWTKAPGQEDEEVRSLMSFREYVNFLNSGSKVRISEYVGWSSERKYIKKGESWMDNGVMTKIQ